MSRLPQRPYEWIDRSRPVRFRFEGRDHVGFAGDAVSSALWVSGVRTLGRSFKYHRPRGILSMANHDVNVMVQDGQRLNVRGDVEKVREGMDLSAVNTWGGVAGDRLRFLDWLSPFLPVGFYYKAFLSKRWFPMWERMFRVITGLGRIDTGTPHIYTPKRYDFCDVLVIGGGATGISAALAAADAGASVVLVDENARVGGSGMYQLGGDATRRDAVAGLIAKTRAHKRIRIFESTLAAAWYADQWVPLLDEHKLTKMRAGATVMASGAFEQPTVFRNNDLPGVMLGSAMQRLIHHYAVQPARRVVVTAANADGYRVALDLMDAGVQVLAVADLRDALPSCPAVEQVRARGIECLPRTGIYEAHADSRGELAAVTLCKVRDGAADTSTARRIDCDGVAMSTGWSPAANLLYQAGTRMRFDERIQQFVPDVLPEGMFACGRVNGVFSLENKLADGVRAGSLAAAHVLGKTIEVEPVSAGPDVPSHPWPVIKHPLGKNFVDFDEDLQVKDFENAVQEGYDNIELLKRFTTVGMGPSQGKHSNMTALRILARLTGKSPQQVGTTTARPFFHPVPMSHLAGRGFNPGRRSPLHGRHAAHGAVFMPAGAWERPEYYAVPGKLRIDCIHDEVRRVRTKVAIIDVGTLGKIEIRGPQAAEFLNRVYTARIDLLKVGGTRYGISCDESGVLIDEGVIARLSDNVYYFTTTTAGAATVYREMSRLNSQWRLECGIINLTGAYSSVNLAGPDCRKVLGPLCDVDLSAESFPYLAVRVGHVASIPARLMRVGFVGEWGYEIHVPAEYGPALWDTLMKAGEAYGIGPFGVEAQRLLRLEKGHLIVSQDTDGLTHPFEVGMDWTVKLDKPFFVGQRSLKILKQMPLKRKLAGFKLPAGYSGQVPQECHLVIVNSEIAGRITSICWSPNLGHHIGLAFLPPDMTTPGTAFQVRVTDGSMVNAEVCETPFFDPQDLRQKE
jgi:sarcosine oxidase subunit alpha